MFSFFERKPKPKPEFVPLSSDPLALSGRYPCIIGDEDTWDEARLITLDTLRLHLDRLGATQIGEIQRADATTLPGIVMRYARATQIVADSITYHTERIDWEACLKRDII